MDKLNTNIILEILKDGSFEKRLCRGIFLKTNNHEYSIFENHSNILLSLDNAKITIKIEQNKDECIEIDSGIFVFQNNNAKIIAQ
mgnify:CR=1 FL=1|jgi:F0F1-type ATP synthase epsilon subunit